MNAPPSPDRSMDERIEAALFWLGVAVIVVVAGLWLALRLPAPVFSFRFDVFVVLLNLSIPLAVVVALCLRLVLGAGGRRIVWIKSPLVQRQHTGTAPLAETLAGVKTRLIEQGFTVQETAPTAGVAELTFEKPKAPRIGKFLDHHFVGTLRGRSEPRGCALDLALCLEDTLLVETGESERLMQLAAFLMGEADTLVVKTTPFTLVCGYVLGLVVWLLLLAGTLTQNPATGHLAAGLPASAILVVVGGWPLLRTPAQLRGLRLAVLGLVFGAVPWAGMWLR